MHHLRSCKQLGYVDPSGRIREELEGIWKEAARPNGGTIPLFFLIILPLLQTPSWSAMPWRAETMLSCLFFVVYILVICLDDGYEFVWKVIRTQRHEATLCEAEPCSVC